MAFSFDGPMDELELRWQRSLIAFHLRLWSSAQTTILLNPGRLRELMITFLQILCSFFNVFPPSVYSNFHLRSRLCFFPSTPSFDSYEQGTGRSATNLSRSAATTVSNCEKYPSAVFTGLIARLDIGRLCSISSIFIDLMLPATQADAVVLLLPSFSSPTTGRWSMCLCMCVLAVCVDVCSQVATILKK